MSVTFPLSSVQRPIWSDLALHPDIPQYNIGGYLSIKGFVKENLVEAALQDVIAETSVLRSTFHSAEGYPFQRIDEFTEFRLTTLDYSGDPEPDAGCLDWMEANFKMPFDISRRCYEFTLLRGAGERSFLCIKLHHLVADGWTLFLVVERLSELYDSLLREEKAAPSPFSYEAFLKEDAQYLDSEAYQQDKAFWKEKLDRFPKPIHIQQMNGISPKKGKPGFRRVLKLDRNLYNLVEERSREEGVTPYHFFLAVVYTYFAKLSGTHDLVLGIPVLNRSNARFKKTIGLFVNLSPLRIKGEGSFQNILQVIKAGVRETYKHQKYPIDDIIKDLKLYGEPSHNLFEITVSFEKPDFSTKFSSFEAESFTLANNFQQTPLAISIKEYNTGQDINVELDFNLAHWDEMSADLFAGRFISLVKNVLTSPFGDLKEVQLLTEQETKMLASFSGAEKSHGKSLGIVELFEIQESRTPDAIAVHEHGRSYTYHELNVKANQIAYSLVQEGIKRGEVVAVCMDRSCDLIVSLLGILKAGAAYLPVDPEYPAERKRFMLDNSGTKVIVQAGNEVFGGCYSINCKQVFSRTDLRSDNLALARSGSDLAYVIYTSGTTGVPNGVMIQDHSLVNLCGWHADTFGVSPSSRATLYASIGFDASTWEIWPYLLRGACLFPMNGEIRLDMSELSAFLRLNKITHSFLPTRICELLNDQLPSKIDRLLVLTGGEELHARHFDKLDVVNNYGPTENTVVTTSYRLSGKETGKIPIGKPTDNTRLYVLDDEKKPLPLGIVGELYVAGKGLAKGYINNEKLTSEKFVGSPFIPSERLYKTGDLVKWSEDGNLFFMGRSDGQVKLSGYRIEPGEIENRILELHGVKEAAVVLAETEAHTKNLIAYYCSEIKQDEESMRRALKKTLPAYMIPAFFVQVPEIPLNASGKIDRASLPSPVSKEHREEEDSERTEESVLLRALWTQVLGVEEFGDFFELGGNSLKAAQLQSVIKTQFHKHIPLSEIFENPDFHDLLRIIKAGEASVTGAIPFAPMMEHYPLSAAQKQLWIISQLNEESSAYTMPGAFVCRGYLDVKCLESAFLQLIEKHESLRTLFQEIDGEPRQYILPSGAHGFGIRYEDLSQSVTVEGQVKEFIYREAFQPFYLSKELPVRCTLLKKSADAHVLMITLHHIIGDGWSVEILLKDLSVFYNRLVSGQDSPFQSVPALQYKDYAVWQNQGLDAGAFREHEAYWLKELEGDIPVLSLPTDKIRPLKQTFNGDFVELCLGSDALSQVNNACRHYRVTEFVYLLGVTTLLLQKLSGQDEIIIGTPFSNRGFPELEGVVGLFINTLPLRTKINTKGSVSDLLLELEQRVIAASRFQEYPFERLLSGLGLQRDAARSPLFDVMMVLDDSFSSSFSGFDGIEAEKCFADKGDAKFDLVFSFFREGGQLYCKLEYNTDLFYKTTIDRFGSYLATLLGSCSVDPASTIDKLGLIPAPEKQLLLHGFNSVKLDISPLTIIELFEQQVVKTPANTAVYYEGVTLTYIQLNEIANRLAHLLRNKYFLKADDLVSLCMKRSEKMVIAILAVLKAGAAYVPLDVSYPDERVRFILEDTRSKVFLRESRFGLSQAIEGLYEEDMDSLLNNCSDQPFHNPENINSLSDLAYVIYTSGSTGNPKGVQIEHLGVVNLAQGFHHLVYDNYEGYLREAMVASFTFDPSVQQLFVTISRGNSLYIVPEEDRRSGDSLARYFIHHQIDIADITPVQLSMLTAAFDLVEEPLPLRHYLLGGDVLTKEAVKAFYGNRKSGSSLITNFYGPTETSVDATWYTIPRENTDAYHVVPIGQPLPNYEAYILNPSLELQPIGIFGELCIGGSGVARGYLNLPGITAEKFISNPYKPTGRLYRTGDIARWLPDGQLEFLGRTDDQVKIRGFRVELREIESALLQFDGITEGIVLAKEDAGSGKFLVAYFTSMAVVDVREIRSFLQVKLPEFMIPAYFVQLDAFPLTASNKIDKKLLPDPLHTSFQSGVQYVPPSTEAEIILTKTWEELLISKRIGIDESFYSAGGDSIKAIQVVSRLFSKGYSIEVKDVFKYPTIRQLALHLKKAKRQIFQGAVTGEIPLVPIQHLFFEGSKHSINQYNQALMIRSARGFDKIFTEKAFESLVIHHDALRITFNTANEQHVVQYNHGVDGRFFILEEYDISGSADAVADLELTANELQAGLDIQNGPLIRLALFKMKDGDRLLFVIHHLVIDGVSWRILLEDFASLYTQILEGQSRLVLPEKTDSYKSWSEQLISYSNSHRAKKEIDRWKKIESAPAALLLPEMDGDNTFAQLSVSNEILSVTDTQNLLTTANTAYTTGINDLLVTALALALKEWKGGTSWKIVMEGHGREQSLGELNVSRTIGWFTSVYPVLLDVSGNTLTDNIINVKDSLHQIPNKGVGYGVLKYLSAKDTNTIDFVKQPSICFNYLGQSDQDLGGQGLLWAEESVGNSVSLTTEREYLLDISGIVKDSRMSLSVAYSKGQFSTDSITTLLQNYTRNLKELIAHCLEKTQVTVTPSDFSYKHLTIPQLESILAGVDVEDIYPLSSMQEGMLFHSSYSGNQSYYSNFSYKVKGFLDIDLVEKSLKEIVENYDALRATFISERLEMPMQVIRKNRDLEFQYTDISSLDSSEQDAVLDKYKASDREKGFRLEIDSLIRFAVFKLNAGEFCFFWSNHHIIMDGWCVGIITQHFFSLYKSMSSGSSWEKSSVKPYSAYIEWLEDRDRSGSEVYWKNYLAGFEAMTGIPKGISRQKDMKSEDFVHSLSRVKTEKLSELALRNGTTLNNLIQALWAVLLSQYTSSQDVLFGTVVSGRPTELVGSEDMVGMFINTIPVRISIDKNDTLSALLDRIGENSLESGPHHYFPLVEIQNNSCLRQNLFDHILVFENYPVSDEINAMLMADNTEDAGLKISDISVWEETSYDLNVIVIPGKELAIRFLYNASVYGRDTITRLGKHFESLLDGALREENVAVKELSVIDESEKEQILLGFNSPISFENTFHTVMDLFEKSLQSFPNAICIEHGDQKITLKELNARANSLAALLERDYKISPGDKVAVVLESPNYFMVSFLAILKSGAAYMPVDISYPPSRIAYVLKDSSANLAITEQSCLAKLVNSDCQIFTWLDDLPSSPENVQVSVAASDPIYVLYTSGSTGKPKGVEMPNRAMVNLLSWQLQREGFGHKLRTLHFSAIGFDVSFQEILSTWLSGGTLVVPPSAIKKDFFRLLGFMQNEGVQRIYLPFAALQQLADTAVTENIYPSSLLEVITAGEQLVVNAALTTFFKKIPKCRLFNQYGPTETHVVSEYELPQDPDQWQILPPIGKPVANTHIYILNSSHDLVPVGVEGEIYIGGLCLANGYIANPQATTEKFISNPLGDGHLYRTGDIGCWTDEGMIRFIGRKDSQVKIRGFRIETGEVESALLGYPGITEAIILANQDRQGFSYLTAYFVSETLLDSGTLRHYLYEHLPEPYIPSYFLRIDHVPYTASGKIDRRSLAESFEHDYSLDKTSVQPRNECEKQLVELWKELLLVENIGIKDNFFDLGGHSLKMTQLSSRIYKYFHKRVDLKWLFNNPTIEAIAAEIQSGKDVHPAVLGSFPKTSYYPLSHSQKRLWLLSKLSEGLEAYNIPGAFVLKGSLQVDALIKAFKETVRRHESLRTRIIEIQAEPFQQVLSYEDSPYSVSYMDLSALPDDQQKSFFEAEIHKVCYEPFDLYEDSLLRTSLIRLSETNHLLIFSIHHIISDGTSVAVLIQEVFESYRCFCKGEEPGLAPLMVQYRDYVAWQENELRNGAFDAQKDFWLSCFKTGPAVLELPSDRPRPAVKTYNGGVVELYLPAELKSRVDLFCRQQGVTLFVALIANLKMLLHRYTGQTDLVVGTVVSGRTLDEFDHQIGYYANVLPLRTEIQEEETSVSFLQRVRDLALHANLHQSYPFDKILEDLDLPRDMSRNPLFDVLLVLQNTNLRAELEKGVEGITMEEYPLAGDLSKFDLTWNFEERNAVLALNLEYNSDLYDSSTALRMARHFMSLLKAFTEQPSQRIDRLEYIERNEETLLLDIFSGTDSEYPVSASLVDLFKEQVLKSSLHIALKGDGFAFSYTELDKRSDLLAGLILDKGIEKGELVGILVERSPEFVIAIIAILKAGGAYLPLDSESPAGRIKYIFQDADLKLVITSPSLVSLVPEGVHCIDTSSLSLYSEYSQAFVPVSGNDLAYVIYTSGSTGQPKGSLIEHKSITRLVRNTNYFDFDSSRNFLFTSALGFDVSTFEIWGALLNGCTLCMPAKEVLIDPGKLKHFIQIHAVDTAWFTSGLFHSLIDVDLDVFKLLRTVLAGGDRLSPSHINRLKEAFPLLEIINGYGPTENTTFTTAYSIDKPVEGEVPIGKPIANTKVYVLDALLNLVPVGVPGEIYIAGDGLSRGYLNKTQLTKEKFIENPFSAGKMYRSGDLGRWNQDGLLLFMGRADDQVKIRGYRVEPGEIEKQLLEYPGIREAVITTKNNSDLSRSLVVYYSTAGIVDEYELRAYLLERLPAYMVPDFFVQLAKIPLTSNGKIDKRALPAPDQLATGKRFLAPETSTEKVLVDLWEQVLERSPIGIGDNFFQSGGHSLKATRLLYSINKAFHVNIDLKALFSNVTIQEQGQVIDKAVKTGYMEIKPAAKSDFYPASNAQKRLWVLSQLSDSSLAYHIPAVYSINGDLHVEALSKAFETVVSRHETLRTVFREMDGEPVQVIVSPGDIGFSVAYTSIIDDSNVNYEDLIFEVCSKPFDLEKGPLMRTVLVRIAEHKHLLLFCMHHIISDGWSMGVLVNEVFSLYQDKVESGSMVLPELTIQYKDYVEWQMQQLHNGELLRSKEYWMDHLKGDLPVLELSISKPRPVLQTYAGDVVYIEIPHLVRNRMQALQSDSSITLFMSLLAGMNALFYRYTSSEDIIIGTPVAGRQHSELENQIGFYVNTLALRNKVSGTDSFLDLLQQVKENVLTSFAHQAYPFDRIVDELGVERNLSRSALFDIMLVVQNTELGKELGKGLKGLEIVQQEDTAIAAKFDMCWNFEETNDKLLCGIEFNTDLFNRNDINRLASGFVELLGSALKEPDAAIASLNLISPSEREELASFNSTYMAFDESQTLVELFELQVGKTPDETAVFYEGSVLSYSELNEKANILAHHLRSKCQVGAGDFVALCMDRSELMVIAILGVLKAGAAYVPVDVSQPSARILYILGDVQARVCLVNSEAGLGKVPGVSVESIRTILSGNHRNTVNPEKINTSSDLAYVIYTSGSTGRPKGVPIEHIGVTNLVHSLHSIAYPRDGRAQRVAMVAPFVFDPSVQQMFSALSAGHSLYIVPDEAKRDGTLLGSYFIGHSIDMSDGTPALLGLLADGLQGLASPLPVRCFLIGGDVLTSHVLTGFYGHPNSGDAVVINMYGPTEASVDSSFTVLERSRAVQSMDIPIGKPLPNKRIYILDDEMQVQPLGIPGELCISGIGLAREYLNQPELSASVFVENPVEPGNRMYKTGDLGRWLPDGNIQFMGRRDFQVKVRGYRIELGEIENSLLKYPDIREAVVLTREEALAAKVIVAYFTSNASMESDKLRTFLAESLPEYMIPSFFVQLDKLPLTLNGKVDRNALPDPAIGPAALPEATLDLSSDEKQLMLLWKDILNRENIGLHDNFFEIGGHSLKLARLVARIHKHFKVKLDYKTLFLTNTIAGQVKILSSLNKEDYLLIEPVAEQEFYELSNAQKRLWFLSQFEDASVAYNMPGAYVFEGELNLDAFRKAFRAVIDRHESLRTVFVEVEGEPRQKIIPGSEFRFELYYDESPDIYTEERIHQVLANESLHKFDLQKGPLIRVTVCRLSETRYGCVLNMHHIIGDGWSFTILVKEVFGAYNEILKGQTPVFTGLRIQYRDYAAWQNAILSSDKITVHRDYWMKEFSGPLPVLQLPSDYDRPAQQTFNGAELDFSLGESLADGLRALALAEGLTLFMVSAAAVNILLCKLSGQTDITVGFSIAGRDHADLHEQIGFYVNTMALRNRFSMENTIREVLKGLKKKTLEAYDHQLFPFDQLIDSLKLERDPSRSPLFDVLVEYNEAAAEHGELSPEGITYTEVVHESATSKFDLIFNFTGKGNRIEANIEYNTDLFSKSGAELMQHRLLRILEAMAAQPELRISDLDIRMDFEREQEQKLKNLLELDENF